MKLIKQLMFALIIGQYMLSATGCSVIGFGIGAISDSNNIKKMEISGEELTPIPKNSHIKIFLKNGQQQGGKFIMRLKQQVGDEHSESIIWYSEVTQQQVSTQVASIERILVGRGQTREQTNGKWIGFGIGGVIDIIIIIGEIKSVGNSFLWF